ncbi:MAG: glycosyltransferase [Propionibacteriaceae bacterium]|nr:glycosyltransferase [Propionibacteriaceae bacterium]
MSGDAIHTFVVLAYKESAYLEECIKSVLNQKYPSKVLIGTSTPNDHIHGLAQKYGLDVVVNPGSKGIGYDYDFAAHCGTTELVTIAHQDDFYDYTYSDRIVAAYAASKNPLMIFPGYYAIKRGKRVYMDLNFVFKGIMLYPLNFTPLQGVRFFKRLSLRFGDPIMCPAVTYVKAKLPSPLFACDDLICSVDWFAYEVLSREPGEFVYMKDRLMGHRIHVGSTTSKTIGANIRTEEDVYILKKFWPTAIAKLVAKLYKASEFANDPK